MEIGWLIHTVGIFGSVREMIEVSNVLVDRGHSVTIYHPDGGPCVWLPCKAKIKKLEEHKNDNLSVLIGVTGWKTDLYDVLMKSDAKLKASCLLGFDPSEKLSRILRGDDPAESRDMQILHDSLRETLVLADSSWQLEWVKRNVGVEVGVPFGGVNLGQFMPGGKKRTGAKKLVIHSNDPRERKAPEVVREAVEIIKKNGGVDVDSYWNRRFTQTQLVHFLQSADVFIDGHRRAGWCNPVIEAMACGTATVCTDIGAVSDFAEHGVTSLVVPVDDPQAMADAALRLLKDDKLRSTIVLNGLKKVQEFSYEKVVPKLEAYLAKQLQLRMEKV